LLDCFARSRYAASTVRRVQEEADRQGLTALCGRQLAAVSADTVRLDDGTALPYSMLLLATGAAAHDFLRRSPLKQNKKKGKRKKRNIKRK
jgi:NADH dehydrogenase FAD-containing subunit